MKSIAISMHIICIIAVGSNNADYGLLFLYPRDFATIYPFLNLRKIFGKNG